MSGMLPDVLRTGIGPSVPPERILGQVISTRCKKAQRMAYRVNGEVTREGCSFRE